MALVTTASVEAPRAVVPSAVEEAIMEVILEDMPGLEEGDVGEDAGRKRGKRLRK